MYWWTQNDLIELFPLIFPYGWGGPDAKRSTKVSKSAVLHHYCRIALPQVQHPQFLLVLCTMWQQMESFTKCIISCRSNIKSSTLADELSLLTQSQVTSAAKHLLSGEKQTILYSRNYSVALGLNHQHLVTQMKQLLLQDKKHSHCDITLVLRQYFLQLHHVMNAVSVFDYMQLVKNMNFLV